MNPQSLTELGLSINEAKVYSALLILKEARITSIASKAELHSKNAYEALDRLIKKGLVSFSFEKNIKVYKCESPMKFREILLKKTNVLDSLLPEMISCFKSEKQIREISIFKGREGLNNMIFDLLDCLKKNPSQEIVVYAPHDLSLLVEEPNKMHFRKFFSEIKSIKGKMNLIHVDSKESRKNSIALDKGFEKFIERRFIRNLSNSNVAWSTVNDLIFINFFAKNDPLYIKIISNDVALALKQEFNILWQIASK